MSDKTSITTKMIHRIISTSLEWLRDGRSFSSPVIEYQGKRVNGRFYINITRVNEHNIHLQEILVANDGENRIFRNWSFKKDGYWQVLSLEREGKHVILVNLLDELSDLNVRIDSIYRRLNNSGFYYTEEFIAADYDYSFEKLSLSKGRISRFFSGIYNELALHPAVFVPILSLAVLVLAFFVGSYFVQVNRIQKGLDVTIDEYLLQIDNQMKNIDSFMADAGGELEVLKDNMEKSKADFDFNRHNAYVNVMRLAEELTKYLPARKEAYRLIASNILESVSYGEIIYEMSQLPSEEYQARIFLATEEQRVNPLSRYAPVFSEMIYPVEVAGLDNDGRGFRITDGYMEKREDPLGSGGVSPHFAVDIINVANIDFISYAGEIVREGMPNGDVVASFEGVVKRTVENDSRYGNSVEISHALSREIKTLYPDAEGWSTFYAHLYEGVPVKMDDWVNTGDTIGLIGNSGRSTGPHLHFEVRIYRKSGAYADADGSRYDKVNPFPLSNKKKSSNT